MRLPAHEGTTAQLGAIYPAVAASSLAGGLYVGRDLLGGTFAHDPFALYRSGVLSNPNMVVLGEIGRGKSAFVKSYLYRHAAFGRRVVVLDPKGEYGALARALGSEPVVITPGGQTRINPLDVGSRISRGAREIAVRRLAGLAATASAVLGRELRPVEHAALGAALDDVRPDRHAPLLGDVVAALLEPSERAASGIGERPSSLRTECRDVALALHRFVAGDLVGMFDGETSRGVDLEGGVVVVDLSALADSPALAAVVACVQSALEAGLRAGRPRPTLLVLDEAWAVLANPSAARFLQSSFKLARAFGVANLLVTHRASDLRAVGPADGVASQIATGLLSDAETLVCFSQSRAELESTRDLLGLSETEVKTLAGLRRGVALWHVGQRRYLVECRLSTREREITDTDGALREAAPVAR